MFNFLFDLGVNEVGYIVEVRPLFIFYFDEAQLLLQISYQLCVYLAITIIESNIDAWYIYTNQRANILHPSCSKQ